ncbi:MAG TPA: hypothetical protein ENH10_01850 [Bacteroidetes bacterium]|nr:hypothetical protein BMS3Bbin04_01273 [bacterium BMS3Bbin04]HDO64761.1 hypothetical protein [Bacteroidota bacterium]HEX03886.1 hypothetical protein [Bacteroidota bacterium]
MNRVSLQYIAENFDGNDLVPLISDWLTNGSPDLPTVIDVDVSTVLASGTGIVGGDDSDKLTFVATGQGVILVGATDEIEFKGPVTGPPVSMFTFVSDPNPSGEVKITSTEELYLEWFGGGTGKLPAANSTAFSRATFCSAHGGGIPVRLLSGIYSHKGLSLYTGSAVLGEGTELRADDQTTQLLSTTNSTGIPETVFLQDMILTGESSSTSQEIEFTDLDRLVLDKVQVRKAETTGSETSTLIIDSCDNVQISACMIDAPCQFDTEGKNIQISQSKFTAGGTEDDIIRVDGDYKAFSITNCIFADAPGSAICVKDKMDQMVVSGNVITQKVTSSNTDPEYAAISLQADQSTDDLINHVVVSANQITTDHDQAPYGPGAMYLSGQVKSAVIAGNMIHSKVAGGAIRCNLANVSNMEQLQFIFVTGNNITIDTVVQNQKAAFWIEGTGESAPIIRIILQGNSLGGYADPPDPTEDAEEILFVATNVDDSQREGIQIVPNSNTLNGQLDGNIYADQTSGSVSGMKHALPRNRYVAFASRDQAGDPEDYYGGLAFADADSTHDLSFRFGSTTDPADVADNFAGLVTTHPFSDQNQYDNIAALHASGEGSDQPVLQCYLLKVQNGNTVEVRRIAEVVKAGWDTGALVLEDKFVYLDEYAEDGKKHLRIASSAPSAQSEGDLVPFQGDAVTNAKETGTDPEIRDSVVTQFNLLLDSLRESGGLKE